MTKLFENVKYNADISPGIQVVGVVNGAWIDMQNFHEATFVIQTGTLGASGTINAKIEEATDDIGTGASDIAAKFISTITTDDTSQYISVFTDDMDKNNNYRYLRAVVTISVADSAMSVVSLRSEAHHAPVINT